MFLMMHILFLHGTTLISIVHISSRSAPSNSFYFPVSREGNINFTQILLDSFSPTSSLFLQILVNQQHYDLKLEYKNYATSQVLVHLFFFFRVLFCRVFITMENNLRYRSGFSHFQSAQKDNFITNINNIEHHLICTHTKY